MLHVSGDYYSGWETMNSRVAFSLPLTVRKSRILVDQRGLRGKCPPTALFTDWLRGVVAHRQDCTTEDTQDAIRGGLEESLRFGTTLLGDIAAEGASWNKLAEASLHSVVFFEMLG